MKSKSKFNEVTESLKKNPNYIALTKSEIQYGIERMNESMENADREYKSKHNRSLISAQSVIFNS